MNGECLNCGLPISGRGKYCSKRCGNRYTERQRTKTCTEPGCDKPYRAKGYCGSHYNQQFRTADDRLQAVPCTVCGTACMKDKRDYAKRQPVCSDMCRTFLRHGHWPFRLLSQKPKPPRPKVVKPPPFDHAPRQCEWCGATYVPRKRTSRFCSRNCTWSEKAKGRRAKVRGAHVAPVNRIAIFERDRWRCKLCGKPVARTRQAPHPKAPVLDHILPLAQGGTHEPANVQLAHFICNSIKGDRNANDQLMLIG